MLFAPRLLEKNPWIMTNSSSYRYRIVDVFTTRLFEGNPLAVFPDADALDRATMQRIAREMNLSETVFIVSPANRDCVARLKIFSPARELDFAGHPTVGAGFVLVESGRAGSDGAFVVEENVGRVPVRVDDSQPPMLWLTTPPIRERARLTRSECAAALGVPLSDVADVEPQLLDAGNPTVFVALRSKEAVDRSALDARGAAALRRELANAICVFVFTPTPSGAYSRMFSPDYGVAEDPATGSATGPLALFMMRNALVSGKGGTRFVSEQGTKMGRRSLLHVHIRGEMGADGIEVGGNVVPVAEGALSLRDVD